MKRFVAQERDSALHSGKACSGKTTPHKTIHRLTAHIERSDFT